MAIIRMIVVDPRPRTGEGDLRVYQTPGHSREQQLLEELFQDAKIEYAVMEGPQRSKGRKKSAK